MTDELYRQAVALSRDGRKEEAQVLLQQVLNQDPSNESAWLWYADTFTTYAERISVLEECLRVNPGAKNAWRAIVDLNARYTPPPTSSPAIDPSGFNQPSGLAALSPLLPETDLAARVEGASPPSNATASAEGSNPFTVIPDDIPLEHRPADDLAEDRSVFTVSPDLTLEQHPAEMDWDGSDVFVEHSPDLQTEVLEGVKAAALILDDAETRALLSEMQGNSPQKTKDVPLQSRPKRPPARANPENAPASDKINWVLVLFLFGVAGIVLVILIIFVVLGYLTI